MENPGQSRLEFMPISLFSIVMGLSGLAIAWKRAHLAIGAPEIVWQATTAFAAAVFVLIASAYAAKIARHPQAVRGELRHPIRMNFFPTASIGLLLLSVAIHDELTALAHGLWWVGAGLHLVFTVITISSWIHHDRYEVKHANPAWFIPVVGNIIVPIVGIRCAPADISWFFFAIGITFWIILLTIVMNRLFFHEPLPERLTPTLFILLAPPAVGFVSWTALIDGVDHFGRVLYNLALFLAVLLAANALRFLRVPFFVSSWAYSFPLAALVIATFVMHARTGSAVHLGIALLLLALLTLLVLFLVLRTLRAVAAREICRPE